LFAASAQALLPVTCATDLVSVCARRCDVAVDPVDREGPDPFKHPFLRGVGRVAVAVDDLCTIHPKLMSLREKEAALLDLARLEARVTAVRLRVLASADDVAADHAVRDAATWLAQRARLDRGPVRRDAELATAVAERWIAVGDALTTGWVNLAQARVCVEVLTELPDDLDPELVAAVEAQLVVLAEQWAPKDLKALGRKILEAIDPEAADAHEAKKLDDEERRAREATSLRVKVLGEGITRIVANLPDHVANRLLTYLDAFTSPRHQSARGSEPPVPSTESRGPVHTQRGHAFAAFLEQLDPDQLPEHGGDATTMIITIGLDGLRTRLAAGTVIGHDVDRLSASEARRLACTAELIPVVLGTDSEVLDLGRTTRLFSRVQRKALRIRDRRCRAEGCTTPVAWTEAHHKNPWAHGGTTDLTNGICLCNFHHHRCHDENYLHEYLPNGDVRYQRRT
jgi:hypothetical protein